MADATVTTIAPSRRRLLAVSGLALPLAAVSAAAAPSPPHALLLALTAPALPQGLAPASNPAAHNSDAEVIRLAAEFIAAELEIEREYLQLEAANLPRAEHRRREQALSAYARRYHERMAAISEAEVTTLAGLLAQAEVMLLHTRNPAGDECHLWNLAESIFTVLGQPLPAWATADA